ncbi:MAG: helix-turn-helix domain-containing protein [Firmicutes bacterium]|nr:helix-turn-helix domain-containing protein [Bacillota bacterium]
MKEIRKERNLTQQELGQALGTSRQDISRVENGEKTVNIETALKWARILGKNVEDIFYLDD